MSDTQPETTETTEPTEPTVTEETTEPTVTEEVTEVTTTTTEDTAPAETTEDTAEPVFVETEDVGQYEVQAKVDEINAQGFVGDKADPLPNEAHSLESGPNAPVLRPDSRA